MDDIMNTLSQVLNDPQSMAQINELAKSLSQENSQPAQPSPPAGTQNNNNQGSADLSSMLSSLFSGQNGTPAPPANTDDGGIDTAKLMRIITTLSQSGANDKNIALLMSLKPLLRNENQAKVDRIIKIFKLMAAYPILRDSGILGGDLFG